MQHLQPLCLSRTSNTAFYISNGYMKTKNSHFVTTWPQIIEISHILKWYFNQLFNNCAWATITAMWCHLRTHNKYCNSNLSIRHQFFFYLNWLLSHNSIARCFRNDIEVIRHYLFHQLIETIHFPRVLHQLTESSSESTTDEKLLI